LVVSTWFLRPRLSHFQEALRYPPAVVAVPIGLSIPWVVSCFPWFEISISQKAFSKVLVQIGALYLLCLVTFCVYIRFKPRGRTKIPSVINQRNRDDWLCNEGPISSAASDRLNHAYRAERVATALLTERIPGTRLMQTVAIRGPYGSGKSSLVNMVKERIAGRRVVFVDVSCWGFENSTRAREYVVKRCVEELSERADCLALRGLPQHYVGALSASGSWGASLASLFNQPKSPRDQLTRFEPILSALDLQLVVVIEDADRNGEDFDPTHIEAMLHDFRSIQRLSFVLTVDATRGFEFPKIAEVIEFLPAMPKHAVMEHLDRVRKELRDGKEFIDPPDYSVGVPQLRPEALVEDPEAEQSRWMRFSRHYPTWPSSAAELISTPRKLKSVMNALRRDWPSLRGEVDIDIWIMVTLLRHCTPGVFTFLGSHLAEIKRLSRSGWGNSDEDRERRNRLVSSLREEWLKVRESGWAAPEIVMIELVPGSHEVFGDRKTYPPNRLQGIHHNDGPDYWERIVAGTVSANDVKDQSVLQLLFPAESNDECLHELARRCVESKPFAERTSFFENYTRRLRGARHFDFMSSAHRFACKRDGARASSESRGLDVLHQEFLRSGQSTDGLQAWLRVELPEVFKSSLRLANDIYHSYTKHQTWAVDCRADFVRSVQEEILRMPPGAIAARLDPAYPWSLYHLVYCFGAEDSEALRTRPLDWQDIGSNLFEEMERFPETMIPQVIRLVGEPSPKHPNPPKTFVFSRDKLVGIFGNRASLVMAMFATRNLSFPKLAESDLQWVELAIQTAPRPVFAETGDSAAKN
jgi:hypothetical protein